MEGLAEQLGCGFWVIPTDEEGQSFEIFLCNSTFEDEGDEIGVLTVFEPNAELYVVFVLCLEIRFDANTHLLDYGWHIQFEAEVQGEGEEEAFNTAIDTMDLSTDEVRMLVSDCLQTVRSLASMHAHQLVITLPNTH